MEKSAEDVYCVYIGFRDKDCSVVKIGHSSPYLGKRTGNLMSEVPIELPYIWCKFFFTTKEKTAKEQANRFEDELHSMVAVHNRDRELYDFSRTDNNLIFKFIQNNHLTIEEYDYLKELNKKFSYKYLEIDLRVVDHYKKIDKNKISFLPILNKDKVLYSTMVLNEFSINAAILLNKNNRDLTKLKETREKLKKYGFDEDICNLNPIGFSNKDELINGQHRFLSLKSIYDEIGWNEFPEYSVNVSYHIPSKVAKEIDRNRKRTIVNGINLINPKEKKITKKAKSSINYLIQTFIGITDEEKVKSYYDYFNDIYLEYDLEKRINSRYFNNNMVLASILFALASEENKSNAEEILKLIIAECSLTEPPANIDKFNYISKMINNFRKTVAGEKKKAEKKSRGGGLRKDVAVAAYNFIISLKKSKYSKNYKYRYTKTKEFDLEYKKNRLEIEKDILKKYPSITVSEPNTTVNVEESIGEKVL